MWNESKNEGGMTEILIAGCGIKILWWEWNLLILTGRMWNSLMAGCGMKNRKSQDTDVKGGTVTLTWQDQDKHPEWGGMAGLS